MMTWTGGQQVILCLEAKAGVVPLCGLRSLVGMATCWGAWGNYCVRDTAAATDRTQSGLSSFLFFLNVNWLKN